MTLAHFRQTLVITQPGCSNRILTRSKDSSTIQNCSPWLDGKGFHWQNYMTRSASLLRSKKNGLLRSYCYEVRGSIPHGTTSHKSQDVMCPKPAHSNSFIHKGQYRERNKRVLYYFMTISFIPT